MRPKSSPADQPNIQEGHRPQVPDIDEVGDMGVDITEIEGCGDSSLMSVFEELIDRLLKIYM